MNRIEIMQLKISFCSLLSSNRKKVVVSSDAVEATYKIDKNNTVDLIRILPHAINKFIAMFAFVLLYNVEKTCTYISSVLLTFAA